MKILCKSLVMAFIALCVLASAGLCTPCDNSLKALNNALAVEPDEMTPEFIDAALQMCTKKHAIYKNAAAYYKKWYKKALNPEKQKMYKNLAQTYYKQAMGIKDTGEMKRELIALSSQREFNKVAFRALRPSTVGAVNTGLDMRINFKRNSYELTGDTTILDQLGEIMKENDSVAISLEGHTDRTGALEYNNQLSILRAQTVKDYIHNHFGIALSRIQVAGYGYKYLLDETHPTGRVNRRVEVIKLSD